MSKILLNITGIVIAGLIVLLFGCSSNNPTVSFVPIETQQLIGRWEGTYSITYYTDSDSAQTFTTDMWIVFTDSTFDFRGEDNFSACGIWGRGSFHVGDNILYFRDECVRNALCTWDNILDGRFTYTYSSDGNQLLMTQRRNGFLWRVDIVKELRPVLF